MTRSRNALSNGLDDEVGVIEDRLVSPPSLQLLVDVVRVRISHVLFRDDEDVDDEVEEVLHGPEIRDENVEGEIGESDYCGFPCNVILLAFSAQSFNAAQKKYELTAGKKI